MTESAKPLSPYNGAETGAKWKKSAPVAAGRENAVVAAGQVKSWGS